MERRHGRAIPSDRRNLNTWDLVHVEAQDAFRPDRNEIFEAFPDAPNGKLLPRLKEKPIVKEGIGLPVMEWAYLLTFRRDQLDLSKTPTPEWKDLWDLGDYPGTRGIRNWPVGVVEISLISLGRNVEEVLYSPTRSRPQLEEQVSDALAHLDEIYDSTTWWETGDQLQRGVASGEFTLATGYSGRVAFEMRELCPGDLLSPDCAIGINPSTAIVATDWWVIPKGARRANRARKLLEAMYSTKSAIEGAQDFSKALGYRIPIEGLAVASPIESILEIGSSANPNPLLSIDERFWSANFGWINDRWQVWMSSHH